MEIIFSVIKINPEIFLHQADKLLNQSRSTSHASSGHRKKVFPFPPSSCFLLDLRITVFVFGRQKRKQPEYVILCNLDSAKGQTANFPV